MAKSSFQNSAESRTTLLAAAIIALAGLAVYANSLAGPFVFDDAASIIQNTTIRHLWRWPGPLVPPRGGGGTVEGRPILNLSLAINYAISGENVWSYHALNLLIHLCAGLALFGIVRRTMERVGAGGPPVRSINLRSTESTDGRAAGPYPTLFAFIVALLWTVHPLQTESVTYIIQRAESLMGLFYLLTLYCFIRGTEVAVTEVAADLRAAEDLPRALCRPEVGSHLIQSRQSLYWYVLSWLACLLGMGTKEVMVSAPLIVFLYDRTFVSGSFRAAWTRRRRFLLALAATWILLGLEIAVAGNRGGTVALGSGVTPWRYALTQFGSIVRYLRLAVWPHPLIFDYGVAWVHSAGQVLPPALVVVALAAATVVALRRRPALGFLGVWFFAILSPTSSFIPGNRQTLAEHRMYLPLAAVIVVLALAAAKAGSRLAPGSRRMFFGVLVAAVACGWGGLTLLRNRTYSSFLALYGDTVAKRPDNPWAHCNYGFALGETGRPAEAMAEFREAMRLKPDLSDAHYDLGLELVRTGRVDQGIAEYEEAVRLEPASSEAHYNLGLVLAQRRRIADAIGHLEAVVRLRPDFAAGRISLGSVLVQAGRLPAAEAQFAAAVAAEPDNAEARYNLGVCLACLGRMPEALEQIGRALQLQPNLTEGHYNYGVILAQAGLTDRALVEFEAAVRADPRHAEAQLDLGNVLLALGRVHEAIDHYEAALEIRPGYAEARHNLAYALSLANR